MPPRPFVNDALWRCLCPRWTQAAVRSDIGLIGAANRISTRRSIRSDPAKQSFHTYKAAATTSNTPFAALGDAASDGHIKADPKAVFRKTTPKNAFVHLSTEQLYDRLHIEGAKGRHTEVLNILNILIKDRRERPSLQMYTALLHSYTSPALGTAGKLRKALEDMALAGIELDARACECALEALAVHPDSFLRTDILEYMRERWWSPSPTAQCFVIAGLLRERCFEMALERLEGMVKDGVKIVPWLWDEAIWILLEFGEVEEAFYVLNLKQTVSNDVDVSLSGTLWAQLLEVASKKHIAEAVSMIWHSQVVTGYLRPTTGTCLNVLSVASRVGNVKLATDVFRVLAERDTVFTNQHYEALLQCYLVANDLPAALSVVLIMHQSSLKITEDELHPLYMYLSGDKERPMNAFMQLQDLERSGREIPTAAVNVCIKACIKPLNNLVEAIEIYKALKSVAKAGPTTATFNELFRGCHINGRKELAMYFASEMIQLNIRPDRITYDRLILTCCNAGDLDDAIGYFEEMRDEGLVLRRGTHEKLIEHALKAMDSRCVALLKWYKMAEYRIEGRVAVLERSISKYFEEGGERKKNVSKNEKVQDASQTLQKDLGLKVDQVSRVGESPQEALVAFQQEVAQAQTGTEQKTEAVA